MISVHAFLCAELVAAAVLALWLLARFPRLGPSSIRSAMALCVGALALLQLAPFAVEAMNRLPYGPYAALFGCLLPELLLAFLAAAWLIRSLVRALGGSGSGPGHYVPASSRR